MNGFEGSFLGNAERIHPEATLECGVCWWVYDPQLGDDTWQVPAGTAFTDLPGHWRCPCCDASQSQFMVLHPGDPAAEQRQRPTPPKNQGELRLRQRQLLAAYSAVDRRMRNLPVYNRQLDIQVVGLRHWQESFICILVTPWCMNILLLPGEGVRIPMEGTSRDIEFPSGHYSFTAGQAEGIGPLESCSLFSPMEQFDDPAVAREVASHALEELLRAPEPEPEALSRRHFLRGGRRSSNDPAG